MRGLILRLTEFHTLIVPGKSAFLSASNVQAPGSITLDKGKHVMTPEDLAQFSAIVAERLDRTVEALTANLSDLRQEITTRLDTIERRTERTETNVNSVLIQLAGISRSLTLCAW
jgi:hypothetical protein